MNQATMPAKPLKGRWVLLSVLTFFGVIIGMNMLMAWFAVETFDGTVEADAYRTGLDFNDKIAAAQNQRALGWNVIVDAGAQMVGQQRAVRIELTLADRQGAALYGAQIDALLWRPTADEMDVPLAFVAEGGGRYSAQAPLPSWGRWQVRALITRDNEEVAVRQDIVLRPQ